MCVCVRACMWPHGSWGRQALSSWRSLRHTNRGQPRLVLFVTMARVWPCSWWLAPQVLTSFRFGCLWAQERLRNCQPGGCSTGLTALLLFVRTEPRGEAFLNAALLCPVPRGCAQGTKPRNALSWRNDCGAGMLASGSLLISLTGPQCGTPLCLSTVGVWRAFRTQGLL